ncbi:MAG: adenylate/guanylate cyclase domain-containing protein [Acidimicrobiia bacterium]|nr:adenylate/guanylate cyclase domain-containing protein [Acidimicrobiia bacterium]
MRVERYFAFVDLCGFTRFTDAQGDEEAVSVLREFRAVVREVASEWGVRIAKWLGDGAMFVSTSAEPLVSAVLELQRRVDRAELTLPLRCGLAGGAVILFEGDDYIGGPSTSRPASATPLVPTRSWPALRSPARHPTGRRSRPSEPGPSTG